MIKTDSLVNLAAIGVAAFLLLAVTPVTAANPRGLVWQPAIAYQAKWCAVISEGYWDCQYRSIEECRPNVLAGNRGWCNPNPYFVPNGTSANKHYRKRLGALAVTPLFRRNR